jgi:CheY-like chemotaxis protein
VKDVLERVLYVEDDPDIRAVGAFALGLGGIKVKSCASGDEAVAAAATFGPQLILLDVMMPGMDGPATLEALRALDATAATPVVFMTAKVQPTQVAVYRQMGAVEVIPKPFDPMTLAAVIREIYVRAA